MAHVNQNVPINIVSRSKSWASRDVAEQANIASLVRDHLLLKRNMPYREAKVSATRHRDGSAQRVVAYLLRKDTYTADVAAINVDANLNAVDVIESYDDQAEDSFEASGAEEEPLAYADVQLVVATANEDIPTAKAAVLAISEQAKIAGLEVVTLMGAQATVGAYQSYLTGSPKLQGLVNVGHGYTGGIVLHDGSLQAAWFEGLPSKTLDRTVLYFNSCQVYNDPLKAAVFHAGARTFAGGIVNLLIGASEEVCKCFWQKALTDAGAMGQSLKDCEASKYPETNAHGIGGDLGSFTLKNAAVVAYEHNDYGGRSQQFEAGSYDLVQLSIGNDVISSVRVPPGWRVTLYQHAGFQGAKKILTADTPSLSRFNDMASSIIVESNAVAVVYEHNDYGGRGQVLEAGRYDLGRLSIGNDVISSVRVPVGWRVTLYQHAGFQGATKVLTADTPSLPDFNDKASSIVVEKNAVAVVYEHNEYGGRSQVLEAGRYDLRRLSIGNDVISSVRVPVGWRVTLYQHAGFQGATKVLTADTPSLPDFNDMTSSIEVAAPRRAVIASKKTGAEPSLSQTRRHAPG